MNPILQKSVLIETPSGRTRCADASLLSIIGLDGTPLIDADRVKEYIEDVEGIPSSDTYVICNGKSMFEYKLTDDGSLPVFRVLLRVLGGKGGFGSLLRGQQARVPQKKTNDACRDLSGRRIKQVNQEKALASWEEKSRALQEKKEQEKKQKREERQQELEQAFDSTKFHQAREEVVGTVADAVKKGLINAEEELKHREIKKAVEKEKCIDVGLDLPSDSDSDGDGESENEMDDKHTNGTQNTHVTNGDHVEASNDHEERPVKKPRLNESTESNDTPSSVPPVSSPVRTPETTTPSSTPLTFDDAWLNSVQSLDDLQKLEPELVKQALSFRGLKCGGKPEERASRLWSVRGVPRAQWDKKILAK